ncbi:hypothetical protein MMC27_001410 [Xylographa pallens]|nr:hypothetical protein [Xylographa pallens]
MQLTNPLLLAVVALTSLSTAQYYNRYEARDLTARDAYAYADADASAFYDDDTSEALYARDLYARDAHDLDALLFVRDLYTRARGAAASGHVSSGSHSSSSSGGSSGSGGSDENQGKRISEEELRKKMAADKPKKCAGACGPMRAHSQAAYDQCYANCMAM